MKEGIIAIDIGTTNIETMLCDTDKNILDFKSERNAQKRFGNDVAARICAAVDGHLEEMRISVLSQICGLVTGLCVNHPDIHIREVVMAGNTTMLHILSGFDCSGLGMYPFTHVSLNEIDTTTHELIRDFSEAPDPAFPSVPVTILPGISAYVGADIYAGAVAMKFASRSEISMLIDLGTNAELVIGNSERILTASAAAGPAFESGRIFKGTEGIEMLDRLLSLKVIDRTGLMSEEYFENSAQKNIRRLLLAKAAIHAAVTVLLDKYGISASRVSNIYVSGNFGNNLNEQACIRVGMFPREFSGRITAVGNTVLTGCIDYVSDPLCRIPTDRFTETVLANEPDFNDMLMSSIDM